MTSPAKLLNLSCTPAKPCTLGVEDVLAHKCSVPGCAQCLVSAELRRGVYCRRLPLDPELPGKQSWVSFHRSFSGEFALGCVVCQTGKFGRGEVTSFNACKTNNLLKHADSSAHRKATAAHFGRQAPVESNLAPRLTIFEKVLESKLQASANRHGPGIGSKKMAKLLFCIKEARLTRERRFLLDARSIALHQDVAGKRLVIKYVACDSKLHYVTGTLGACHVYEDGRGASGLAESTRRIIQTFCTPFHGLNMSLVNPRKRPLLEQMRVLLTGLEEHICNHIEMYDTDAARDEMVAGRLLASSGVVAGIDRYLPNVKIFKKDSTHAVKRSSLRTFTLPGPRAHPHVRSFLVPRPQGIGITRSPSSDKHKTPFPPGDAPRAYLLFFPTVSDWWQFRNDKGDFTTVGER